VLWWSSRLNAVPRCVDGCCSHPTCFFCELDANVSVSDVLNRGHISKMKLLFRLADQFDASRWHILRLTSGISPGPSTALLFSPTTATATFPGSSGSLTL
jgi:hypothetical protein